ncbi:8-oxo-dGTP pyrophosphatase MutT (NUDIX family) [Arthrobacter pigmenti]|uniref:8-oxo-dGTP pyrophosphatase MutT (NUDIX family) n=1 Tax=Arthrobacter pigmenti TaxID=271432 RepID=A0A846RPR2_9MICC|nr:NUDIX domain-containing protein [Arthrobacter pigmenti]NJC21735.1 8-oxo-dGTP pyrophosphatase MutT (NUDIX family) [Arthrobacter pigmenti]
MPTPDFVLALRSKIGNDPLWLPGAAAVVYDDDGRVLLGRRADNGQWTIITGIIDPGEQPAQAIVREVMEETGVVVEVEHLVGVDVVGPVTFPNGDVSTFLSLVFRCRYLSGEARVNDDESSEVRWFDLQDLPPLNDLHRHHARTARHSDGVPYFVR